MPDDLDELLEAAKHHKMTPAVKRAQRISWIYGEMEIESPGKVTREEVERIVDDA